MPPPEMDLGQKVEFLSDARAYEDATTRVEARETHMSWVFMTDRRVYKLKKPVKYPFLDFSTLARRRFFCGEELRLNRRLAPQTYLGTVALRCDRSGVLSLGNDPRRGRVVDWLVEMRRLPDEDMLDTRIADGRLRRDDVIVLGDRLAEFYAACPPETADGELYLRHLAEELTINRAILMRPDLDLADLAAEPLDAVDAALAELTPSIQQRVGRGLIVEGHGDLRPEHVCLIEPLQIIDCLEFNRSMRIIDPYDELNYLGLECDMLGAGWIRPLLLEAVLRRLGSQPDPRLLSFYWAFRALLRARLCLVHLLEPPVRDPDKWKPLARRYVAAAQRECRNLRLNPPSPAGPRAAGAPRDA